MTYQSLWRWRRMDKRRGASVWSRLLVFSLFVLVGCATAYQLPPLTANHPAHPEAMTAPQPPPSTTLAYGSSDLPSPQPAITMVQHEGPATRASGPEPSPTFVGEGKVIAVVPNAQQIVIDHGEIKGFMDAMTMGYRVEPPSLLEGVKAGDQIRFTIDAQKKAIVEIGATSQPTFVGEGKVIAVVPSSNQIVLEHGDIKGFMDAMTMGYRVEPPSLLKGVKAGDQIRFSIGAQQKAIIKIEKLHP